MSDYPYNLVDFYRQNPQSFIQQNVKTKKLIYAVIAVVCLILIIYPAIIPVNGWLVRIVAIIALLYSGAVAAFTTGNFCSLSSGGKIESIVIKKFDLNNVSEQQILAAFQDKNFSALADMPEADNQPVQLYIDEDKQGQIFYCQILKYLSSSEFRGITPVLTIEGENYQQMKAIIKTM